MLNRSTGQVPSETGEAAYGLGNVYKRTYTSKNKSDRSRFVYRMGRNYFLPFLVFFSGSAGASSLSGVG
jgi:hypothetical protein